MGCVLSHRAGGGAGGGGVSGGVSGGGGGAGGAGGATHFQVISHGVILGVCVEEGGVLVAKPGRVLV